MKKVLLKAIIFTPFAYLALSIVLGKSAPLVTVLALTLLYVVISSLLERILSDLVIRKK